MGASRAHPSLLVWQLCLGGGEPLSDPPDHRWSLQAEQDLPLEKPGCPGKFPRAETVLQPWSPATLRATLVLQLRLRLARARTWSCLLPRSSKVGASLSFWEPGLELGIGSLPGQSAGRSRGVSQLQGNATDRPGTYLPGRPVWGAFLGDEHWGEWGWTPDKTIELCLGFLGKGSREWEDLFLHTSFQAHQRPGRLLQSLLVKLVSSYPAP